MTEGVPTLEGAIAFDTSGAFGSLVALDGQIDSTTANAITEWNRVKQATAGGLNLARATSEAGAFERRRRLRRVSA